MPKSVMARIAVLSCSSVISKWPTALLGYLDLIHRNTLYFSNSYNNYQCSRPSDMWAGDGKQRINKCWLNYHKKYKEIYKCRISNVGITIGNVAIY